jgi:hypothetical protein
LNVRGSAAVYPDETSARMNGQRWWLWVFATAMATVYVQRPSRGADVIEEVLGKDFRGLMGHDGWAPYDKLSRLTLNEAGISPSMGAVGDRVTLTKLAGSRPHGAQAS